MPTRFPNGLTNQVQTNAMGGLPILDPSKMHVWFDDFDNFTAADWVITTVEAGAGNASETIVSGDGGLLVITNDDADNDADSLQWAGGSSAVVETFKFQTGKQLFFKTRLKVSDATQSDLFIGLAITDTTPYAAVSDGVFFRKDDGDAILDVVVEKNANETASAAGTLVSDTFTELAFVYDGASKVTFWQDNKVIANLATTNLPDDEDLAITFQIINGEAVAKSLTIDYILVAKER